MLFKILLGSTSIFFLYFPYTKDRDIEYWENACIFYLKRELTSKRDRKKTEGERELERERERGLILVSIGFRGREIACLAAALGLLACLTEASGPWAWLTKPNLT